MARSRYYSAIAFLILTNCIQAQQPVIQPNLLSNTWPARWISCPGVSAKMYGVYHFRKTISLVTVPDSFPIHVTADNRYRLFINGKPVCNGPARGDLFNWYYESVNIVPYLQKGNNTLAALVWNMGEYAPVAQVTNQTGFLLQGDGPNEQNVNTDRSWKVFHDPAYAPASLNNGQRLHTYMVIGPGDSVNGSTYPWLWEQPGFDDSQWKNAVPIADAVPAGYGTDNQWTLAPRSIPLFHETQTRFASVRRSSPGNISTSFIAGNDKLQIPPGTTATILLDHKVNCVAYPEIKVSGGQHASIKLTYAESLFDAKGNKGNRDEIEGKSIKGNFDIFIADGGKDRIFRPLWFRGFRYVELEITTKDEPLTVDDIYAMSTGYPLEMKATFTSNDPSLRDIWNTGWRTAQLCAGEVYFDCPYYEQLQYTADTRIQALISLYMSGDDRLMRKAITDFYHSRTPEGLTQGRYPSNRLQIIPTFSLFWISMIHDYWMHRKDDQFIEQFFPAIDEILTWYDKHLDTRRQMLGPMKWWNFADWSDAFPGMGVAPGAEEGNSSIISLQYSYTLQQAAALYRAFNKFSLAGIYEKRAMSLNANTFKLCFDGSKNLMADTPEKKSFSQHAGIWSVLSGAVPAAGRQKVMEAVLSDTTIGQVTFFYRFYLTQALKKAGMANLYYRHLTPWRNMLKLGLTTFAEKPEPTRSDCHAWSASPNYDFLATICGIVPSAPGFEKVEIAPALGELTQVEGSLPHPWGLIAVRINRTNANGGIHAEIFLPGKLTGVFTWNKKTIPLKSGKQVIDL